MTKISNDWTGLFYCYKCGGEALKFIDSTTYACLRGHRGAWVQYDGRRPLWQRIWMLFRCKKI